MFLDKRVKTEMTRVRGWFARRKALHAKVPHGHWKTLAFIGALRKDEIVAPCVFDGPIDAATFSAYVEQSLAATLKPGDVVVLDNLGRHKDPRARRVVRAAGAHLLLPPALQSRLQADRNGLRQAQDLFRKADARATEEAWRKVGSLPDIFLLDECARYLSHAGYGANTA